MVGVVEEVELLGSERLVWARVGAARVAVRVPARHRDPAGIRLVDPESGRLLPAE